MIRTPRTRRKETPPAYRLRDRDLHLFATLMKTRFLTTNELAKLHFAGSRDAANKRLRKLFDVGLVQIWLKSLNEDNLYSITRLGLQTLEKNSDIPITAKAPTGLDGSLDQVLAINRSRIALAFACEEMGTPISWWFSDWELRARVGERLIPDALFQIECGENEPLTLALEVDNNTRSRKRFIAKMRAYALRRERQQDIYGHSLYSLLVVGISADTIDQYRRSLEPEQFRDWVWFTNLDKLSSSRHPLCWMPVDDDTNYSLRDALFLPYRKEGIGPISC